MKNRSLFLSKRARHTALCCAVCLILCAICAAQKRSSAARAPSAQKSKTQQNGGAPGADELNDDLDTISVQKPTEQIAALKDFLQYEAPKEIRARAKEMLIAAYAAAGNERLNAGDLDGCLADFREALKLAPSKPTDDDKLFVAVVQLPANLFLRGETGAAIEMARSIEAKAAGNPKRLLAIAIFYLGVEQDAEAARVAQQVIQLAPNMSEAYQTLGATYRIGFKLEDAVGAYQRALELDPKSANARRNLADLKRALGKTDASIALYREQLAATPDDKAAQSGLILAMFDAGNEAEAKKELHEALVKDRNNLPLLVGAAYWFDAHKEFDAAYELAQHAVRVEPRYTWGHIALARALLGTNDAPAAERSLRYAKEFGNYPTLSYEYANALAANGYYAEAAEELARSFSLKDGQIETRLAGRLPAQASNFLELLAPERRAGIFQNTAADSEANARQLKSLLAFYLAVKAARSASDKVELNDALRAADFVAGDDAMSAFRQMYVASRLLELPGAVSVAARAFELTEMAIRGAEAALNSQNALNAIFADELRDLRAQAYAQGVAPQIPQVPRQMLSNIFRGRIEDAAGWALFLENKPSEAVVRLKRAVSVLPPNGLLWRGAMWHLGAALDANGDAQAALNAYLKSYDAHDPDPSRRAIIEAVYRRVNGSPDGLDAKIGAAPPMPQVSAVASPTPSPAPTTANAANVEAANAKPTPATEIAAANSNSSSPNPIPTPTASPSPSATNSATKEASAPAPPVPTIVAPPVVANLSAPLQNPPAPDKSEVVKLTNADAPSVVGSTNSEAPSVATVNEEKKTSAAPPRSEERLREKSAPPVEAATNNSSTSIEKPASEPPMVSRAATHYERPRRVKPSERAAEESGLKCVSVSASQVMIEKAGEMARLVIKLNDGVRAADVKTETPNWADIVIVPQTENGDDNGALVLEIRSISARAGDFKILLKSPCGSKEIGVVVKQSE